MSVIEKIDMFRESLPRKCLYCQYGYPVVFGIEQMLDSFACGKHCVDGLTSKKLTLKLMDLCVNREGKQSNVLYCPMVDAWEACEDFIPIKLGDRKFKILDMFGYFDDVK